MGWIIARYSPTESIQKSVILEQPIFRPNTWPIGLGILSFAFSCQHSSLIIAGSLKSPTQQRWNAVCSAALTFCSLLAIVMGSYGYIGFMENTKGNILNNFPLLDEAVTSNELVAAKAANVAAVFLCGTMFFVYPLESFVCRHVVMTNLFRGQDAKEGFDYWVLDRFDRRAV